MVVAHTQSQANPLPRNIEIISQTVSPNRPSQHVAPLAGYDYGSSVRLKLMKIEMQEN